MKPASSDVQLRLSLDELSAVDLAALIAAGAVRQTRRTEDGRVIEYELTQLGRTLLTGADNLRA